MYGRGISYVSQLWDSQGRSQSRQHVAAAAHATQAPRSGPHTTHQGRRAHASAALPIRTTIPEANKTASLLPPVTPHSWRFGRWYRRKKRGLYLAALLCELLYIFATVPLRIGFFFNPYSKRDDQTWTTALTIYTVFDVLAELSSLASVSEIFHARGRALAARALEAGMAHVNPRHRRHQRLRGKDDAGGERSSLAVAWSLNTIVPTMKQQFEIRRPLLLEAIAMLPIELLAIVLGANWLHVLRIFKLIRLHRVGACLRELQKLFASRPIVQLLDLTGNALIFKRIVVGLALCHWIACAYMTLAHWQCGLSLQMCTRGLDLDNHTVTNAKTFTCWAIEDQLVGASLLRKYARAVYWSSRTIITLGYYDVAPVTDIETAFGIVVQVVGAVFSTSLIATFLFVFRYLNARKQAFMAHVDEAKEYMKMSRIPDDVSDSVLSFYRDVWHAHSGLSHDDVLARLPDHLRVGVRKVLIAQRIHAVAFLTKESDELINTLALQVELCAYSPKEWIIEKVPTGMFFILRGKVILETAGQSQPRHVTAGDHFAESALLVSDKTDERARARTYCELYKLSQAWFRETIESIYGPEEATQMLDAMRATLSRRDQQQQKAKRLFGRSVGDLQRSALSEIGFSTNGTSGPKQHAWQLPGSTFRRWWEHARLLALVFVAYEVPFFIVFDTATFPFTATPVYNIQSISSVIFELLFTADFMLRSRCFAFIDAVSMIPVTDASYIFQHYKDTSMWLDLVSILPIATALQFTLETQWTLFGAVFRLVRLLRLRHLPTAIRDMAHMRRLSSKVQTAITLILAVTLSIHLTGCLWFLMARLSMSEHHFDAHKAKTTTRSGCLRLAAVHGNCSWALFDAYGQIGQRFPWDMSTPAGATSTALHRRLSSSSSDVSEELYTSKFAYLRSIYWAIVALTTVGYGDIVAFSTAESLFAALWVFFGGIINYAVVAAMSNLLSNLTAASRHHMEKMNLMNTVLAHYKISDDVRHQIRRFYHQQYYIQKVASEAKLLARLPQQLRHRISLTLHAESITKLRLFVDFGQEHLLHDLTGLFRRAVYQRGDYLTQDSAICDEIIVVVSGRGNVFCKRVGKKIPVGAVRPGSCCGVSEMMLRVKSATRTIATTVVEVSAISYSLFRVAIEAKYPNEVMALTEAALDLFEAEARALDAICDNILTRDRLRRCTDRCTSMVVETKELTSAQQYRKSQIRFYWDLLILLIDIYFAFQITFRIPFLSNTRLESGRHLLILSDLVGDAMLASDIVAKLYYFECDSGLSNILTRTEINANYAQHLLKQDLWSLLPLYYFGENYFLASVLRVPRLLRIRQIPEAIDSLIVRIQQRVTLVEDISAYLAPFKLVLILLFSAHFCACVFYWISTMDQNDNSWIHHDHVVHEAHGSVAVLYLRGYYWALTTLTLVGSREIVPLDVPGTMFASTTCLCCTFVVGHIVGELSDMILEMDKAKKELHERESSFEQFAKDHNLPALVRTRVVQYLKLKHDHWKGLDIYETFHDLSKNLKMQLMMDLHGDILRGLYIAPYLSSGLLRGLAVRLKSELYIPGDNVAVEGDPGHKLYILKKGSATVMWKCTGTAVATLSEGSLFGEVAFFLRGTKRIASVQAAVSVEVLVVGRSAWESVMASCDREEQQNTERVLVKWVKQCLQRYNIMAVEIVKDIKCATLLARSPGTLNGGHSSRGLEEHALRLLLRQVSQKKGIAGSRSTSSSSSLRHVVKAKGGGTSHGQRGARRVYVATEDTNIHNTVKVPRSPNGATVAPALTHRLLLLASPMMKNDTTQQLFPVADELRDLYSLRQLQDMEDECWRRYKVSLLMSDSIVSPACTEWPLPVQPERKGSMLASAILEAKAVVVDRSRKFSVLARRKSSLRLSNLYGGDTRDSQRVSLNSSHHDGVTTDGMRFLANYQMLDDYVSTANSYNGRMMLRREEKDLARTTEDLPLGRGAVQRRRLLKRTQSLPIFDRQFADMVREELRASNVKDYGSKLQLGIHVSRQAHRPELFYLYRVYKWWQRTKKCMAASPLIQGLASLLGAGRSRRTSSRHRYSLMSFRTMRRESKGPPLEHNEGEVFFDLVSRGYRIWQCVVVLIAVMYAIALPYLIAFASRTKTQDIMTNRSLLSWIMCAGLMDVFCVVDLVLKYTTFKSVMETTGESSRQFPTAVPRGQRRILPRISAELALDVFAAVPFEWLLFLPQLAMLSHAMWYYFSLLQFNKIFRIYQAKAASERLAQFLAYDLNLPITDRTLRFIRSIGAYLLAGHWIACVWYRVSLYAYEHSPTSWLSTARMLAMDEFTSLEDIPDARRYLRAAHFAAGSITTVFFGDIASSNVLETVTEIGVILLSIFVFGMVVGAHSEYLEAKYKHRMQFEQNLTELYYYLKSNNVPRAMRHRLKMYYMNTWLRFHGHGDFEGVDGLSTLLVEDIAQYTLRSFASKVSILRTCDECFLRALLTCLKNVICSPNEPVVCKGDVDRSMYFIAHGKIIVEGKGFQLVKEEGDFFGELSLLYGIPRSATCSSLGTSLLYVLEWHAYEALLQDYPEYRQVNRREWVVVSTVLRTNESRFRSIIGIVSRMENMSWVQIDSIIKKAKSMK
jgi:CRP-like cAMP-binding protein/voltage-gated potassium channel Kch